MKTNPIYKCRILLLLLAGVVSHLCNGQSSLEELKSQTYFDQIYFDYINGATDSEIQARIDQIVGLFPELVNVGGNGVFDAWLSSLATSAGGGLRDEAYATWEAHINAAIIYRDLVGRVANGIGGVIAVNQTQTTLFNRSVFTKTKASAKTTDLAEDADQNDSFRNGLFGADVFYGAADLGNDIELTRFGTNLSYSWGSSELDYELSAPLFKTGIDGKDSTTMGLDFNAKYAYSEVISFGGHVNFLNSSADEGAFDGSTYSAGPYVSLQKRITEDLNLSGGAMLDLTGGDIDSTFMSIFGANLGYSMSDKTALNFYNVWYVDMSAEDYEDSFWMDFGAEVEVLLGNAWFVRLGLKTTAGYDAYDGANFEGYLGSAWRF